MEKWKPMTTHKPALRRGSLPTLAATLAFGATLLSGCAQQTAAPAASTTRVFAADLVGGAKTCKAAKPALTDGKTTETMMTVGNDGGWCAIGVSRGGKPFSAGLLTTRPEHGKIYVHQVGDETRIDYTPMRGYVGKDVFAVRLVPGDAIIHVPVTVAAP